MAKAKNKEVEEPVIEEVIEEVQMVEQAEEPKDITEEFIARKLRAINSLENPARKQRLANRLLRKRR